MTQVEDAGIQTDFVDLQTREKELNRLVFLLQVLLTVNIFLIVYFFKLLKQFIEKL